MSNTQKEYLKKYLSIGKDRTHKKSKKKKVKPNTVPNRLTIIDDNDDTFEKAVKEDLLEDEDAPQIVAVIDERPPSLQVDEKSKTNMWIPIGSSENAAEIFNASVKREPNEDLSPPRFRMKLNENKNENEDMSPPRKRAKDKYEEIVKEIKVERDISPPRKRKDSVSSRISSPISSEQKEYSRDLSPPRPKLMKRNGKSRFSSPPRIKNSSGEHSNDKTENNDLTPPRRREQSTPPRKMTKTLDGKTAGLQNAKQLAAESSIIREREAELFKKMSSDISGANAATIVRDKKTGKVRNLEEEATRDVEKKKREEVNKEKYSRWGRGLKQVEDATKRREDELHEMSKPLARYADDEDLDRHLKEQEREGDPMLAYIRKKKRKKDVEEGKPSKPEYMGEFMPNRFGIRPGHRWDGVDRSNGYEKKWFDIQNSKMAQQEEAYKWSTEDM